MCVPYRERPLEAPHGATGPVTCDKPASLRPAKPARLPWLLHDDAAAVFSLLRSFASFFLSLSLSIDLSLDLTRPHPHLSGRSTIQEGPAQPSVPPRCRSSSKTHKKVLQAVVFPFSFSPSPLLISPLPSVPRYSFLGFFGKHLFSLSPPPPSTAWMTT